MQTYSFFKFNRALWFFITLFNLGFSSTILPNEVQQPLNVSYSADPTRDWTTGYQANITVTNPTSNPTTAWSVTFDLPNGQNISSICNANYSINGNSVTVTNPSWPTGNAIPPQGSVNFSVVLNSAPGASKVLNNLKAIGIFAVNPQPQPGTIPLNASATVSSDWGTGYVVDVKLSNLTSTPTTSWSAKFNLANVQERVSSLWNANYNVNGSDINVENTGWNGKIPAGGTISFGFTVSNTQPSAKREILNLQATGVSGSGPTPTPAPAPSAPVLNSIILNSGSQNSYTVSWNNVSNATSYTLQEDTNTNFSNPKVVHQGSGNSKSFVNQPNGTYYYRVMATNSSGNSNFSNVNHITINYTPPIVLSAPVLQAINNPNASSNYTINWSSVTNAQSYSLQQSTTSNFSSNVQTLTNGTATSYQVSGAAPGTYYYRVTASAGNIVSPASNIRSTTVAQNPTPTPTPGKAIVEGYWESWSPDSVQAIASMKTDVIDVSFVTFTRTSGSNFNVTGLDADQSKLTQLVNAAHNAGKKVKIAVGGASYGFGGILKSDADALGLAKAISSYIKQNNLDGLDVDIEDYPAANVQVAFLKYARQELGSTYNISYTPKTPASTSMPYAQVLKDGHQYVNYFNLMCYDAYQGYSYQNDVQKLIDMGVPASKIVVGLMPGRDDIGIMTSLADISTASNYVLQKGLAGIMFWSLNRDYRNVTGLGASAATNTAWGIIHK